VRTLVINSGSRFQPSSLSFPVNHLRAEGEGWTLVGATVRRLHSETCFAGQRRWTRDERARQEVRCSAGPHEAWARAGELSGTGPVEPQ
jgi:hypothetical protein